MGPGSSNERQNQQTSIIFVDANVAEHHYFLNAIQPHTAVYLLPQSEDGIEYITQVLQQYPTRGEAIAHIHIIAHGFPGGLYLGSSELTLTTLKHYETDLTQWFSDYHCQNPISSNPSFVSAPPQLFLYGCHVAAGDAGEEFLNQLQTLTRASLHASTTAMGNPKLGGDNMLDVKLGQTVQNAALDSQLLAACPGILGTGTDGFYRYADSNEADGLVAFTDISTSGSTISIPITGDGSETVTLPFDFNFYGTTSDTVRIGAEGGVLFNATNGDLSTVNASLPTNNPGLALLPFWTDLQGNQGEIYYTTLGSEGNRRFIVQWTSVPHADLIGSDAIGNDATFQLVLHEGSNNIDFVYQDVVFGNADYDYGENATIGLNKSSSTALQYSRNDPSLNGITSIRFFAEPQIIHNQLTLDEAETVTLTLNNLQANDFDSDNNNLTFLISNLQHGHFEINGTPQTSFTQAQIIAGLVKFVHDGSENEPSYEVRIQDGSNTTPAQAASIEFNALNDAPTLSSVNATLALNENTVNDAPALIDAGVLLSDPDSPDFNGGQLTLAYTDGGSLEDQLSIQEANGITVTGSAIAINSVPFGSINTIKNGQDGQDLVIDFTTGTATVANVKTLIQSLTYQNTADAPAASRTLSITVNDGDGGEATSTPVSTVITITADNDAPTITLPESQTINEDNPLVLGGDIPILIEDTDSQTSDIVVTLTTTQGTIALGNTSGVTADGDNSGNVTLTGSVAAINSALEGITFTPTLNFNGTASIQVDVNDQGNSGTGGALSDRQTLQIAVTANNDQPLITVPDAQTINEDTTLTFANTTLISITDVDADNEFIKVTVSNEHGQLKLSGTAGLSVTGDDTGEVVLIGALTAINDALDAMTFTPDQDFNGLTTINVDVDDLGNSGEGGALSDTQSIDVTVTAINDDPINTVPTAQFVNEDSVLNFSTATNNALAIGDVDADEGTGLLSVNLLVSQGELTLAQVTGLTFTLGDGSADTLMSFKGTLTDINAALAGLTYQGNENFNGIDTLSISTSDQGNTGLGGTLEDSDDITITVKPVNDIPTQIIPGGQSINEDSTLVFSNATDNAITVADLDAEEGTGELQVTLSVTKGNLTLAQTTGLTLTEGDGNEDVEVSFKGSIADINAALDGLLYANETDFNGNDVLTVTTSDLGNNGSGGPKIATSQIEISDNSVNDAPVITAPVTKVIDEDDTLTFNDISISDVDAGNSPVSLALSVDHGVLALGSSSGLTVNGDGMSSITVTGSLTQINAALDGLVFTPDDHFNGIASLRVDVDDQGNTGLGNALTDTAIVEITVNAMNDQPTSSVPGAQVVNEDTDLVFSNVSGSGIVLSDVDVAEGTGDVQVELMVNHGTLTLGQITGLSFTDGNGSKDALLTFTGSIADVNTALEGLTYQGDRDFNGADILTLTVNDQGNTGEGGALMDTQTIDIDVRAVNDAPINIVPVIQRVNEDSNLIFSVDNGNAIAISDVDVDEPDGTQEMEVELAVTQGALILGRTDDLTSIIGNGTSQVVLSGTQASINTALDRMAYRGNPDFNGSDTLTITTRDQGNTGLNGLKTDIDTIAITVDPVNDAPGANSQDQSVDEGGQVVLKSATFAELDLDDTAPGLNYGVTVNPSFGRLELSTNPGIAITTFSQQQLDADQLIYVHDGSETIVDSFDFSLTDGGEDNANAEIGTIVLQINPINDAPIITEGDRAALSADEDSIDNLITFNATDAEGDSLSWRVLTSPQNGQAALFTQPTVTSQVIRYTPEANFNGSDQFQVEVADGKGGIDIITINVDVAAVNDIPVLLNRPSENAFEDIPYTFMPSVQDIDGDRLTFSSPNLPDWLTLDADTGALSGQPSDSNVGTSSLTLQAFDGTSTVDILTFDLTVEDNEMSGTNQADRIEGTEVDNVIHGLQGDDQLFGLAGNDQLLGNQGQDSLYGGDGQDTVFGGGGRDRLRGGKNSDKLYGERGRDFLNGENGNDSLYGGNHQDRLFGGKGDDLLEGGQGNDLMRGGKGRDVLKGDQGVNQLWGNAGKDVFVLDSRGMAIIKDFKNGQDKLAFAKQNGKKLFSRLGISQQGKDTLIEYNGKAIATLAKTNSSLIDPSDFLSAIPTRGAKF